MFAPETAALLESRLPALPRLIMAPTLRHDLDDLMAMTGAPARIAVVDDNDTAAALGDALCRALRSRYSLTRIACGKAPAADDVTVAMIRRGSAACDLLVAVGSGTISDLCKYASHRDGKPYVVFPTAASMNGYLSAQASITVKGYKTSLPAHLPLAVFCDAGVIAAAPARLHRSGLGDALARPTAQADWLLSHRLLATPYDADPFRLTADLEPGLWEGARGLALSDPASLRLLMQVLLLSGLGMTIAGGSYPASQSEHMIAHAHEMLVPHAPATLHGEQIGVTTLTAAARQERLLAGSPVLLDRRFPDAIEPLFGSAVAARAQAAYAAKCATMEQAGLTQAGLTAAWPDIAAQLAAVMLPSARIAHILKEAQAPRHAEALGWSAGDYAAAVTQARFLRDRFTCLELTTPAA